MVNRGQKRIHEEESAASNEEDYYEEEGASSSRSQSVEAQQVPQNIRNMAYKMVRGVFALEHKKTLINKNQLQKYVWETESYRDIKFDTVFKLCQEILDTVFGYNLQEVPQKEVDTRKRKGASKKPTSIQPKSYMLVSTLPEFHKQVLGKFWQRSATKYFQEVDELKSAQDNVELPMNQTELISNALVLITISCVALSSNNINKAELIRYFKNHFDLSPMSIVPGIYNGSGEKATLEDFLRILERNDYLDKRVEKNDEHELVEYFLGRRAKVEFPEESLIQYVLLISGIEDPQANPEFIKQIKLSIGNAYADSA